jgi:hypothetical protein
LGISILKSPAPAFGSSGASFVDNSSSVLIYSLTFSLDSIKDDYFFLSCTFFIISLKEIKLLGFKLGQTASGDFLTTEKAF